MTKYTTVFASMLRHRFPFAFPPGNIPGIGWIRRPGGWM